jgi:hypothetical protein
VIIFAYSIYDFLTNIALLYLDRNPTTIFLYSSFTFFEYSLFAAILYMIIKNRFFKKMIITISILFTIFLILYDLIGKVKVIDSIPIGIEAILILIYSFYYLFEQMKDTENLFIYSRYPFWLVIAMMLYLAGSFFIYIYASQLGDKEVERYWIFTNIFCIIKNILFTFAIVLNNKQSVEKKHNRYPSFQMN